MNLDTAIETARHHLPIMKSITIEEAWSRFAIVNKGDRYAVYKESAWQKPEEAPMLAWSAPTGKIIGYVELDGSYTAL